VTEGSTFGNLPGPAWRKSQQVDEEENKQNDFEDDSREKTRTHEWVSAGIDSGFGSGRDIYDRRA
jgi:hypothetical protein